MRTRLIIARHGNTFETNEIPRRVGKATDLSLTENDKGKSIGQWLKKNKMIPSKIYAAPLKRTQQTAQLALEQFDSDIDIELDDRFSEIDYGPDENKTEEEVWRRLGNLTALNTTDDKRLLDIGRKVIKKWNTDAQVPSGWKVNPKELKDTWNALAKEIESNYYGKNILVVTSNGLARFAPIITGDFETFSQQNILKISTGALCIFEKSITDNFWECMAWNLIPDGYLSRIKKINTKQ